MATVKVLRDSKQVRAVAPASIVSTYVSTQVNRYPVIPGNIEPAGNAIPAMVTTDVTAGQPVRLTTNGLALAAAAATVIDISLSHCVGLALESKPAGQFCLYASDGSITRNTWAAITSTALLIPGRAYYLGQTAGTITADMPTTGVLLRVGYAVSPTVLDIELGDLVVLSNI